MNLQKFTLFLVVAIFLSFPLEVEAKKSSWGSSSKKSYSSKKSSTKSYKSIFGSTKKKSSSSYYGSSSKKPTTSSNSYSSYGSSSKKPTTTSSSYGSSSTKSSHTPSKVNSITASSFDKARLKKVKKEESKKAYKEYKETKTKFKEAPKVAQANLNQAKKTGELKVQKIRKKSFDFDLGFDDYYSRKHSYYDNYKGRNYIYNHRPSFGIWDAVFLWALLDNPLSGATHVYNHYNDNGIQEWLNVAKEEAKTNEEIKQKLSQLENEVAKMQSNNVQKDESYLPNNIAPDLAFSDNFVEKNRNVFYKSNEAKDDSSNSSWTSVIVSIAILLGLGYWLIFVRKS